MTWAKQAPVSYTTSTTNRGSSGEVGLVNQQLHILESRQSVSKKVSSTILIPNLEVGLRKLAQEKGRDLLL